MKEKTLPIEWKGWDEQGVLQHSYYDVTFLKTFGVFKKGNKFSCIFIDYGNGIIEAYNEDGTEVVKTQKFVAAPIEN